MAKATALREKPVREKPMAASIKVKRILCGSPNAANQLRHLREQFGTEGEVLSPRQKRLTQAVFGKPLSPSEVVARVCNDVRQRGLPAVLHYTEQFDKVKLTPATLRVSAEELDRAHAQAD